MSLRSTTFVFSVAMGLASSRLLAQAPSQPASAASQATPLSLSGRAGPERLGECDIETPSSRSHLECQHVEYVRTDPGTLSGERARRCQASKRQIVASRGDLSRPRAQPGNGRAHASHPPGSRAGPHSAWLAPSQPERGAAGERPTNESASPRCAFQRALFPALLVPTVVGPFNYFDLRSTLTQKVFDLTALNNYRSAQELLQANVAAMRDARDLVAYAVAGAYLQATAAEGRLLAAPRASRDGARRC